MVAKLLDGKQLANAFYKKIKSDVETRLKKGLPPPGLAVILVGEDPASEIYVKHKRKACEALGFFQRSVHLPQNTTQAELIPLIEAFNEDSAIHGILVQLPLPPPIQADVVLEKINFKKDVDGFHPYNIGRLSQRKPLIRPCTPLGIMKLLETTKIDLKGLHAVVVGASNIVGRPMALELLMADCTITVCHIHTKNLKNHVEQADILISAAGCPHLISGAWIKSGAMVIDVGIHRLNTGEIIGDIDFESAAERASWITPVPGGVGPMTVAMLLYNTLLAADTIGKNKHEYS